MSPEATYSQCPVGWGPVTANSDTVSVDAAGPEVRVMGLTHMLIDPIGQVSSGISTYTNLAVKLSERMRPVVQIVRRPNEARDSFQRRLADLVTSKFAPDEVLIEAPEAHASTIHLPPEYATHIRLHCPRAIGEVYENKKVDQNALNQEISVIQNATIVSAPSHAVVREVRKLTPLSQPMVFPNPLPSFVPGAPSGERDIDVLFLGRFHRLKGKDFLPDIAWGLPSDLKILFAGPDASLFRHEYELPGNVLFRETVNGAEKEDILGRSRVIVVPSLFESFSMVVGEALSHGAIAIAWDNGAAGELAPAPLVRTVPFGDIVAFRSAVLGALKEPPPSPNDFRTAVISMITAYEQGASHIFYSVQHKNSESHKSALTMDNTIHSDFDRTVMVSAQSILPKLRSRSRWRRKLKKLRRDPTAFFRDAWFRRVRPTQDAGGRFQKASLKKESQILGALRLQGDLPLEFADLAPVEKRWSFVFFIHAGSLGDFERNLFREFEQQSDFVGFRQRQLFKVDYDETNSVTGGDPVVSLVNRIHARNKDRLARFQNLVFVNPRTPLPYALRACASDIRIFIIFTEDPEELGFPVMSEEIDVLFVPTGHSLAIATGFRRKFVYEDKRSIVALVREAGIEAGPKAFNMLIPVFNGLEYRPELTSVDTSIINGIITLSKPMENTQRFSNFRDFRDHFSKTIISILLVEETYLKYRTLCDEAQKSGDWSEFIGISVADGARYEVHG